MRQCDYLNRTSNMCGMSTLGAGFSATPLAGLSIVPPLDTAQQATLWDHCGSWSNFGSGQSTPPSEIDSIQGHKVSWPDYSYPALNDNYVFSEALTNLYYKLLQSTDK